MTNTSRNFASKPFRQAILRKGQSGYSLSLVTKTEVFPVLTKYAGELKTWATIDSAMAFIRKNHPQITIIIVKIGVAQ